MMVNKTQNFFVCLFVLNDEHIFSRMQKKKKKSLGEKISLWVFFAFSDAILKSW